MIEEYRKEGMLDEAIEVLQTGLEKHPAYTSARVLLGKIYLEKGMLPEATKEFESVIASVPDNLFMRTIVGIHPYLHIENIIGIQGGG